MLSYIFSSIADYIELTIAGPFKLLSEQYRAARPRKRLQPAEHFSFFKLLQKQRLMCSPEREDVMHHGSPRACYVRETYIEPVTSEWIH